MKRHFFTRSLFVVIAALFVCVPMFARELNPFAFKLSEKLEGDVFTVTYYLNAPADNVKVVIEVGSQTVTYDCSDAKNTQGNKLVKGIYHVPISLRNALNNQATDYFRNKNNLHWRVEVIGGNTAAMPTGGASFHSVLVDTEYAFFAPAGIDIDTDPQSENFGMIYCTEAKIPETPNSKYYSSYYKDGVLTASAGLYVFDAAFQNMPPFDKDESNPTDIRYDFVSPNTNRTFARNYNLGLSQTYNSGEQAKWDVYAPLAPRRVRLSDDGRLFVSLNSGTNSIVKELNTARLRYDYRKADGKLNNSGWFWNVFSGATWNTSQYRWQDASGNVIIAPNVGLDVRGSGANLKLFAVSGDKGLAGNSDRESCHFAEFNLGTAKTWSQKPSKTNYFNFTKKDPSTGNQRTWTNCIGFSQWNRDASTATWVGDKNGDGIYDGTPINAVVFYDYVNFEYDQYGGVWMCQFRDNQTEATSLAHINASGTVDFMEHVTERKRGGVRYNKDFSKLIVVGGQRGYKTIATNHTIKHQDHHDATFNADKSMITLPKVEDLWATLYTVKHTSANSKPVFTDSVYIYLDIQPADFAWDYAGNLYAVSTNKERVCAYALPNGGKPVTTPCRDTSYIENTNVGMLTVKFHPNTIAVGTACDNNYQNMDKYNESLDGFNFYYRYSAKFQLLGQPADGYRFYCWVNEDGTDGEVGVTVSSQSEMKAAGVERTAKFGIDVNEMKDVAEMPTEVEFPGAFVSRELDNESYSTICLPFDLKTLVGTPYQGASVLKFVGVEKIKENGVNKAELQFEEVAFSATDYMEAGVPYLIKVTENIQPGTIGYVKLFKDVKCPHFVGTNEFGGFDVAADGFTFRGVMNPSHFEPSRTNLFMVADNRLATLYEPADILGLRGYFTAPDGYDASKVHIKIMDKTATSVETVPEVSLMDSVKAVKYLWNGRIYIQRDGKVYDITGFRAR